MPIPGLFIAGTDTGVGKTYVSALLVRELRRSGFQVGAFKPFCCGEREDAEILAAAADLPVNDVNPVWLRAPASPYATSLIENRPLDVALVREKFRQLQMAHPFLVVEGVGGWRVPITASLNMSDLAVEMGLPVLLVVRNRLGCLNHALLTLESIARCGLECHGIILNEVTAQPETELVATATNRSILETLCNPPIISLETGATTCPALAALVSDF